MSKEYATLLDTETTDLNGQIVQIGSIKLDKDLNVINYCEDLVDPEVPISIGAMAIHNITEEMVKGKPLLDEVVEKHLPKKNTYLLAYNAPFDIKMLGGEEVLPEGVKVIDVLAIARDFYPKKELSHGHKNAEMFYGLGCYKDFNYSGELHTALYDCRVTLAVLRKMLDDQNMTLDEMYNYLNRPFGETDCYFKKYRGSGKSWNEVFGDDYNYCEWLYNNVDMDDEKNKDLSEWLKEKMDDI